MRCIQILAMLLMTMLTVLAGCTKPDWIERTLVTVDVTGTWEGTTNRGTTYQLGLEQSGPGVKGSLQRLGGGVRGGVYTHASGPGGLEGTVSGDAFTFKDSPLRVSGQLTVRGDEMSGEITDGLGTGTVTLRRISPSSSPQK